MKKDSKETNSLLNWEWSANVIAVKIHWFGLVLGFIYVNVTAVFDQRLMLDGILVLAVIYNLVDTYSALQREVFLKTFPWIISVLEASFIGLLCYFDTGLHSPFRYYYLLSLICCAIRYSNWITYLTCALDCLSFLGLSIMLPAENSGFSTFLLIVVMMWVTVSVSALSNLIKSTSDQLQLLNRELQNNQMMLESRIEEGTRQLQETQAQLMHQEKMAGFGLLAAGIAHEVGNPLTSISSLVQMLDKRPHDEYTHDKLKLVAGELTRIQGILRELINFSRPASLEKTRFQLREIVQEALGIAKFYKGIQSRQLTNEVQRELPYLFGIRDQLVQVVFNLILNAIDATAKGGSIWLKSEWNGQKICLTVADNGSGIAADQQSKLFQPYFTTKKQGTGLGLFVTRKLVENHGGKVSFTSELNQGTLFRVELPVPEETENQANSQETPPYSAFSELAENGRI